MSRKFTLAHEDLSVCLSNHLLIATASLVQFVRRVAEYLKAVSVIAVCHTVTESGSPSSVGITTRCRQIALPISFAPAEQVPVTLAMPIALVPNLATRTLLSSMKHVRSTAFSVRIGITVTDRSEGEQ